MISSAESIIDQMRRQLIDDARSEPRVPTGELERIAERRDAGWSGTSSRFGVDVLRVDDHDELIHAVPK
jgi:hypothetical protein